MTQKCWCGFEGDPVVGPGKGEHYAEYRCPSCKGHLGWMKKPDNRKAKRESNHLELVQRYSKGFCEICLIRQDRIPRWECMVGHHVIEYEDGGSDERSNVQILCSACHRFVHWHRTYKKHLIPESFHVSKQDSDQPEVEEAVDQLEFDSPGEGAEQENADAAMW